MATKFKRLVEVKRIDPSQAKRSSPKSIKILEEGGAYIEEDNANAEPILEKEEEKVFDLRLRHKFITRGNWSFQSIEDFKNNVPDKAEDVVPFKTDQPALGLFDEKTLKRVQRNFPYKVKNKNSED